MISKGIGSILTFMLFLLILSFVAVQSNMDDNSIDEVKNNLIEIAEKDYGNSTLNSSMSKGVNKFISGMIGFSMYLGVFGLELGEDIELDMSVQQLLRLTIRLFVAYLVILVVVSFAKPIFWIGAGIVIFFKERKSRRIDKSGESEE